MYASEYSPVQVLVAEADGSHRAFALVLGAASARVVMTGPAEITFALGGDQRSSLSNLACTISRDTLKDEPDRERVWAR